MEISDDQELKDFIEKKIKKFKIEDLNNFYTIFSGIILNSIIKTYNNFNNLNYSLECSNIIYSIYWLLILYSSNIKLTMFLCDRAIILFNEYLKLSKSISNPNEKINILDVKLFIIKKTLGPLKITENKLKNSKFIVELSFLYKKFITKIFINFINNKFYNKINLENFLKKIEIIFLNILYKITKLNGILFVIKNINKLELIKCTSVNKLYANLNQLKINLEIYLYILKYYKIENSLKNYKIYKQYIFYIKDLNINYFCDESINLENELKIINNKVNIDYL